MSRLAKQPIPLPQGVKCRVSDTEVTVKGPKGELAMLKNKHVEVEVKEGRVYTRISDEEDRELRAYWGLVARLIQNMIQGVVEGFQKKLEINGVGYKANMKGDILVLNVGYSHVVEFPKPKGIEISVEKNVIIVSGIDKQLVGQTAAQIRKVRKPEPYKGKGIKYSDEVIRRKAGKVSKTAGT